MKIEMAPGITFHDLLLLRLLESKRVYKVTDRQKKSYMYKNNISSFLIMNRQKNFGKWISSGLHTIFKKTPKTML